MLACRCPLAHCPRTTLSGKRRSLAGIARFSTHPVRSGSLPNAASALDESN